MPESKLEQIGRAIRNKLKGSNRKVKKGLGISNKIGKIWKRSWKI